MIEFACSCGKRFSVPDNFAGRTARCKACGSNVTVPQPFRRPLSRPVLGPSSENRREAAAAKLPMRTRRLLADAEQMSRVFANFSLIKVHSTTGDPPEVYQIEYRVKGLAPAKGNSPAIREQHLVEIQLTSDYPRLSPLCKMLT